MLWQKKKKIIGPPWPKIQATPLLLYLILAVKCLVLAEKLITQVVMIIVLVNYFFLFLYSKSYVSIGLERPCAISLSC